MKKCRKAINFDLRINNLRRYFNEANPNYAYDLIHNYMISHDFIHRQYSGYVSNEEMTENQLIKFVIKMSNDFPWLHKCLSKCDSTDISNLHDLIYYFNLPFNGSDENAMLLYDTSNEYKLYLNRDGEYVLFDEYDNEVGITDCDNIEEALEEFREKEQDLEL